MLKIADTDSGFYVLVGDRAYHAGFDSLSLGDVLQACQGAQDDSYVPFGGAVIPTTTNSAMRKRGARIVATSA